MSNIRVEGETLMTLEELAIALKLMLSWVYSHADDLGVYRCGKCLRFSLPRVLERLENRRVRSFNLQPNDLHKCKIQDVQRSHEHGRT